MQTGLSPKKQRFLAFIRDFAARNDRAPTFKEIMQGLHIKSLGTINWYVSELEKLDVLKRTGGSNAKRALAVVEERSSNTLPLLGSITAGYPLEAVADSEEIEVPPAYLHRDNYVLRVKGDSLRDDNIQDGDYVIIRQKPTAMSGDTVVAFVNEEATLKRYYPKSGHIELHPRNPAYETIYVGPEDSFRIGGIVLFVFREYETSSTL